MTTLVLHGVRAPSWNTFYAGRHWTERKAIKDEARLHVLAALAVDTEPFDVPVDIVVTAVFRRSPLDPDNICSKVYIDALKGRVLRDDNPACVRSVKTISKKAKRECVVIQVTPVREGEDNHVE